LKELRESKMLEITSLGKSNGLLDIPLLKIRNKKPLPEERRPIILIIGR
jgi:hypothetical protein